MTALTDLRNNLTAKTKSLKRRRGSDACKVHLDKLLAKVQGLIDFVKRLQNPPMAEGKQFFDTLSALVDDGVLAGQLIWKRVLNAYSMEEWSWGHMLLVIGNQV